MKVFLASSSPVDRRGYRDFYDYYRLESFFYATAKDLAEHKKYKGFLLDSGAFTYLNSAKGDVDWDKYIERYADTIKQLNIEHFMELDIDPVVGLKEVERLRARLEKLTGKRSIPVWHKSRGKQYWLDMIKNYDYVAIGGIVTREIKPSEYKYFHWLLYEARKQNCKVHGLGFTNLKQLNNYSFHSVDSTSWTAGGRFGQVYKFTGEGLIVIRKPPKNSRVISKVASENNFMEWVKFSQYMDG